MKRSLYQMRIISRLIVIKTKRNYSEKKKFNINQQLCRQKREHLMREKVSIAGD